MPNVEPTDEDIAHVIVRLLKHSERSYGTVQDETCGIGKEQAEARTLLTRLKALSSRQAVTELHVVYADTHDYDAMSQWLVGAFDSPEKALAASVIAEGEGDANERVNVSTTVVKINDVLDRHGDVKTTFALSEQQGAQTLTEQERETVEFCRTFYTESANVRAMVRIVDRLAPQSSAPTSDAQENA